MAKRTNSSARQSRPGRLRIVAGNWRSRLLEVPDVPGLRPTSERIRETLFNWLAPRIAGARCLDLYAGTGALGFEALSRGAGAVHFVERSGKAAAALRRNVDLLGATTATVIEDDAFRVLQMRRAEPYDIVFLDPPFDRNALDELCRLLSSSTLLAEGAWVYLEDDRRRPPVALPDGWQWLKQKEAGGVRYALVEAATLTPGDS